MLICTYVLYTFFLFLIATNYITNFLRFLFMKCLYDNVEILISKMSGNIWLRNKKWIAVLVS